MTNTCSNIYKRVSKINFITIFLVLFLFIHFVSSAQQSFNNTDSLETQQVYLLQELGQSKTNDKPQDRLKLLNRLIHYNIYEPNYHYQSGLIYYRLNEIKKALASFTTAMENKYIFPGQLHMQIAKCYAKLRNNDSAMHHLDLSVENKYPFYRQIIADTAFSRLKDSDAFKKRFGILKPETISRNDGWRMDLNYLMSTLKSTHFNLYTRYSIDIINKKVIELENKISELADLEIIGEFMKIAAMAGDGHTLIRPVFKELGTIYTFRVLPLKLLFLKDGYYVISAPQEFAALVGGRITRIGGVVIDTVIKKMSNYIGGDNSMFYRWTLQSYLTFVDLLMLSHAAKSTTDAEISVIHQNGSEITQSLSTNLMTVAGLSKNENRKWVQMRDTTATPGWLRDNDNPFWFSFQPEKKLVYFKFNQIVNKPDISLESFVDSLFRFIKEQSAENLVIDLRHNNGGDFYLSNHIIKHIIKSPINSKGHLFIITGRETYSATVNFCSNLETWTNCIFVGEPPSASPNFTGENTSHILPYSRLSLSVSYVHYQYSNSQSLDKREWIAPLLATNLSADDFSKNVDVSMRLIYEYLTAR